MARFTKWLAILTFALCIVGSLQWCSIHNQLTEMQEARKDTERLFRTDERAWVELGEIKIIPESGAPDNISFSYEVSLKNVGKTSAHDIAVYAGTRFGPYNLGFDKDAIAEIQDRDLVRAQQPLDAAAARIICIDTQSVPKVLAPGSQAPVALRFSGSAPRQNDQPSGWEYTYLVGRIDYSDAFKVKHWLKFCFVVEDGGQGALRQCQEGNDEDRD